MKYLPKKKWDWWERQRSIDYLVIVLLSNVASHAQSLEGSRLFIFYLLSAIWYSERA